MKDMVVMKVVSIAVTGIDEVVNISVSPARSRPLSHTYLGLEGAATISSHRLKGCLPPCCPLSLTRTETLSDGQLLPSSGFLFTAAAS